MKDDEKWKLYYINKYKDENITLENWNKDTSIRLANILSDEQKWYIPYIKSVYRAEELLKGWVIIAKDYAKWLN